MYFHGGIPVKRVCYLCDPGPRLTREAEEQRIDDELIDELRRFWS